MKVKPVLYLSASLNLILAMVLAFGNGTRERAESPVPKWTPREVPPGTPRSNISSGGMGTGDEQAEGFQPRFRWGQIESEDYAKYIKNLRSVGCPETTIHDIVEADIGSLYEDRYHSVLSASQSFDEWRLGPRSLEREHSLRQQIAALDEERVALLRGLFGEDYRPSKKLATRSVSDLLERSHLGFLSPSLQESVMEIESEFESLDRQLRWDAVDWTDPDALESALTENKARRREALAGVLGEEGLFELELRDSPAASALRRKLNGFDVSEEQFRAMFAQRQRYETEQGETPDRSSPEAMERRHAARDDLEAGYQEILGKERYVDMQRQGDPDWAALKGLEEKVGLSREVMNTAYELRREAGQELLRSMTQSELDEDEREALAVAARAQYRRELVELIGEKNFEAIGDLRQPNPFRASGVQSDGSSSVFIWETSASGQPSFGINTEVLPRPAPTESQVIGTREIVGETPAANSVNPEGRDP